MLRFTVLALTLVGCAAPVPEESPLEGPGFDPETGALIAEGDDFVVVLTHLQVRNRPRPGRRFGELANAIGNDLFETEPDGWLGAAFRNVGRLNWWTITVWESEEQMIDWVVSEPHVDAMSEFSQLTVGGETRKLDATPEMLPLAWPDALDQLISEPDVVRGDSDWFAEGVP